MSYQIIYHTDAENDIRTTKKWYKNHQAGLEKSFALALKETIIYIIENPLLFEVPIPVKLYTQFQCKVNSF